MFAKESNLKTGARAKRRGRPAIACSPRDLPQELRSIIRALAIHAGVGAPYIYAVLRLERFGIKLRTLEKHIYKVRRSRRIAGEPPKGSTIEHLAHVIADWILRDLNEYEATMILRRVRKLLNLPNGVRKK